MTDFAFLFPGQGSQAVGMLDALQDHPAVRHTLAEASEALGEDVGRLIHAGPKDQLDLTSNTQPVMLTARGWRRAARSRLRWPAIRWASTPHSLLPAP
jgi:[acyl-carrier-protein] S-malonyltransferase